MAERAKNSVAPVMQPGLRAFIIYNSLRETDLAFEIIDGTAEPHLHRGEFAIIDTTDRELIHGEMYLIEWACGRRQIVDAISQFGRYGKNGVMADGYCWFFGWMGRVLSPSAGTIEATPWRDGPYQTEQAMEKIVGKVVGIYEPDFRASLAMVA